MSVLSSLPLGTKIAKSFPAALLNPIKCQSRIIQVISNLISNALNFTRKGVVTITKSIQDGSAVVSVKDTGSGIDPQILPRLFTKFTTRSERGTGLGLHICKRIIEAHGGKIWGGNNIDGKGATFSLGLV